MLVMEEEGYDISHIDFDDKNNIIVYYITSKKEVLPNDITTYKNFYNKWLYNNEPCITDLYKSQMINIVLASTHNSMRAISYLQKYFSKSNEDDVKMFLTYMRNREFSTSISLRDTI